MPPPPSSALQVSGWENIPHLVHGFCGRDGGTSSGAYCGLNLSFRVGDRVETVEENWRRVCAAQPGVQFVTMQQVHGTAIRVVRDPSEKPGEADALVSELRGVAVGVLTADCVPILLVAPRQRVVAAVHAGWRGTVAGIAAAAVRLLQEQFHAESAGLLVAMGPSIGACCYEVDAQIGQQLEQRWGAMPAAVRSAALGKAQLDLRGANAQILAGHGVPPARMSFAGPCTRCAAGEYFSYRAAGGPTGRQLSYIGWRE